MVRSGAVVDPHYRLMGLHGSEYWTYTRPAASASEAARLTQAACPSLPRRRSGRGLVDHVIDDDTQASAPRWRPWPSTWLQPGDPVLLAAKARQLAAADTRCRLPGRRTGHMSHNFPTPHQALPDLRRAFRSTREARPHLRDLARPTGPIPSHPVPRVA